jgi:hypothetical protein
MDPIFEGEALAEVGREAARIAWEGGMTVLKADGTVVPIPLVAEPEVMPRATLDAAAREAGLILSGAVKLAKALLAHGDARDREALLGPFAGLEAEAMARLFDGAPQPVLVARVDFLVPEAGGPPRALELNATIPAMPAYADLASHSWLRAAARARGLPPRDVEGLVARCGSHMENLRVALVDHHLALGGAGTRPSIALVARPGDAQIGELRRLAGHFRQMGHRAENLLPADCVPGEWGLLYRHVWAHRVPPESPFAAALLDPARFPLVNPVNGLLEAKALFARLSECAGDGALAALAGLSPEELAAAGRLPVTRRLDAAMAARVKAEREGWVLKRSWDYGGKSVHLGAESDPATWPGIVDAALGDARGGGFIAQERIFARRGLATRITPDEVTRGVLYRDLSTYCGLGARPPSGSVVRAAASPIVNILGGGGLAPVIPEEVAASLR